jgi:hypothetical protein
MGEQLTEGIYEDLALRHAIYHFFPLDLSHTRERYNAMWPKWGFKFPSLHNHLFPPQLQIFRSPRLVVVFRDALAVAKSAKTSPHFIVREQTLALEHMDKAKLPTLMISYEKALAWPGNCVQTLAAFCGLKASAEQMSAAVARFGVKGPYLEAPHED